MTKILSIDVKNNPEGTLRDMTAEEEAERTAQVERDETEKSEEKAAFDKKVSDKASAKAKLIAGEALTEDEADTIVL